jgi:hypothetical protein
LMTILGKDAERFATEFHPPNCYLDCKMKMALVSMPDESI